jgi:hypothetical protein
MSSICYVEGISKKIPDKNMYEWADKLPDMIEITEENKNDMFWKIPCAYSSIVKVGLKMNKIDFVDYCKEHSENRWKKFIEMKNKMENIEKQYENEIYANKKSFKAFFEQNKDQIKNQFEKTHRIVYDNGLVVGTFEEFSNEELKYLDNHPQAYVSKAIMNL